jgi:hypothetical protein
MSVSESLKGTFDVKDVQDLLPQYWRISDIPPQLTNTDIGHWTLDLRLS